MEVNNIHTEGSVLHRQHGPHYLVQWVSVWRVSRWCCPEPHQRQIPVMIKDMKSNSYDNNLKKTLLRLDLPRLLFVHIWLIIECFWKFPFLNLKFINLRINSLVILEGLCLVLHKCKLFFISNYLFNIVFIKSPPMSHIKWVNIYPVFY